MTYIVDISRDAHTEMLETFVWKGEHISVEAAKQWFNGVDSLAEMPKRCPLAPEAETFSQEIRQLLYGKRSDMYRILFTVQQEKVLVLHVRYTSMQVLTPKEWEQSEE